MGPDGVLGAQEILNRDITIAAEQRALAVCQQGLEMLQKEAADLTRYVFVCMAVVHYILSCMSDVVLHTVVLHVRW